MLTWPAHGVWLADIRGLADQTTWIAPLLQCRTTTTAFEPQPQALCMQALPIALRVCPVQQSERTHHSCRDCPSDHSDGQHGVASCSGAHEKGGYGTMDSGGFLYFE